MKSKEYEDLYLDNPNSSRALASSFYSIKHIIQTISIEDLIILEDYFRSLKEEKLAGKHKLKEKTLSFKCPFCEKDMNHSIYSSINIGKCKEEKCKRLYKIDIEENEGEKIRYIVSPLLNL